MNRVLILAMALALTASCGRQAGDRALRPQDFAVLLPLEAAAGDPVQRVDLSAEALVGLKRADRGDIRIFDANGRPLATALLDAAEASPDITHLEAIPVAAQTGTSPSSGVSVRVERDGSAVTVDTENGGIGTAAGGVLFDARKLTDPAQAIILDADLPIQRPVTMTVEASDDLKSWHMLAEQVLFRPGADAELLGSGRIELSGTSLTGQYLRVSWGDAPEARITGASVFTTRSPSAPRIAVPTNGLSLVDSHHLRFTLPPGPTPSGMRLTMTGQDGVVPLRLFGRDHADEPWVLLAVASLRQGATDAMLETGDSSMHEFSLEADSRSAGFSQAPRLALLYDPINVLVAFNGAAPYQLTVGDELAGPTFFAVTDLGSTGPYPLARLGDEEVGDGDVAVDLAPAKYSAIPALRTLALWSALILGAIVLIIAAYRLFRTNAEDR